MITSPSAVSLRDATVTSRAERKCLHRRRVEGRRANVGQEGHARNPERLSGVMQSTPWCCRHPRGSSGRGVGCRVPPRRPRLRRGTLRARAPPPRQGEGCWRRGRAPIMMARWRSTYIITIAQEPRPIPVRPDPGAGAPCRSRGGAGGWCKLVARANSPRAPAAAAWSCPWEPRRPR